MGKSPDQDFITIEELVELFPSLTPGAIYSARSRGQEPASLGVRVGKRLLFRRSDVLDWFERQKTQAVA
jgi:hypothetical protein